MAQLLYSPHEMLTIQLYGLWGYIIGQCIFQSILLTAPGGVMKQFKIFLLYC